MISFKALLPVVRATVAREAQSRLILHADGPLVERQLSAQSPFCRACVAMGYLTVEQMERAARRYRLGQSRDGGVIFWQIDQLGHVYEGKVMYYRSDCHRDHGHLPTWVSYVLRRFYLGDDCDRMDIPTVHCLFGTHLLRNENADATKDENADATKDEKRMTKDEKHVPVAVVEAEKTAVILSELFPQCLWLAAGGLHELTEEKLFPLRHHRVILFPDTDPQRQAFTLWYDLAQKVRRSYGIQVSVSPLLEQHATAEQKRRKIDLVDFIFENRRLNAPNAPLGASIRPV